MMKIFMCNIFRIIEDRKYFLYLSIFVYFIGIIIGLFFKLNYSLEINPKKLFILEIFIHNFWYLLLMLIFGLVTFGVITIILLIVNGIFIGINIHFVVIKYGFFILIKGVLPHLFFELIAIFITAMVSFLFFKLKKNYRTSILLILLKEIALIFSVATLLIFISAIIECTVSSALIRSL